MCIKFDNNKISRVKDGINYQDEEQEEDEEIKMSCNDKRSAWFRKMKKTLEEIDEIINQSVKFPFYHISNV